MINYDPKPNSKYDEPYAEVGSDVRITDDQYDKNFTFQTDDKNMDVRDDEIKIVKFLNHKIDFVPREVMDRFPNFDMLWISDAELTVLNWEYLNSLLRFMDGKVVRLSFEGCRIKEIDPNVKKIFEQLRRVDFSGNVCMTTDIGLHKKFSDHDLKPCNKNSAGQFVVPTLSITFFYAIFTFMLNQ